jgi:hypothetical protein
MRSWQAVGQSAADKAGAAKPPTAAHNLRFSNPPPARHFVEFLLRAGKVMHLSAVFAGTRVAALCRGACLHTATHVHC